MSQSCLTCDGLIAEPGVAYGYVGKFCHCCVPPKVQIPSNTFHYNNAIIGVTKEAYDNLLLENKILKAQLDRCKEQREYWMRQLDGDQYHHSFSKNEDNQELEQIEKDMRKEVK